MANLGKSTTPTWPTFGWVQSGGKQEAILQTVPTGGGLFSSVSFWAARDGGSSGTIYGVIWDASTGNVLAFGQGVSTSGGVTGTGKVGSTQWYTDTFASPVFIAGGTQIYIGWQPASGAWQVDWAYNGNDNSPNAQENSASGTSGQSFAGHSTASPAGAVAAYATYTPGNTFGDNGSTFQAGVQFYADNGTSWVLCTEYADNGTSWVQIG